MLSRAPTSSHAGDVRSDDVKTPLECGWAPAEIRQGRRLRNTLPDVGTGLDHAVMKRSQTDRPGGLLPLLETGSTVLLRSKGAWTTKAKVIRPSGHPSFYDVTTEQGRQLRRNRRHLLLTCETFCPDLPEASEDEAQPTTAPAGPMTLPLSGSSDAAPSSGVDASPILRRSQRRHEVPKRLADNKNFLQVP